MSSLLHGYRRLRTLIYVGGECLGREFPITIGGVPGRLFTPLDPGEGGEFLLGWEVPSFIELIPAGKLPFDAQVGWGTVGDGRRFYG